MSLSIRKAEASDLALIMRYIHELAHYEKLEHDVCFDETRLREELFGSHAVAWVWLAEWESQPAGFALCFYNFSTFLGKRGIYLEDLYVAENYRGKGIGKALLTQIAQQAISEDCGRLEWQVLDWNQPSIDFYDRLGAKQKSDWLSYQLTGDALKQLAEGA